MCGKCTEIKLSNFSGLLRGPADLVNYRHYFIAELPDFRCSFDPRENQLIKGGKMKLYR